MWSSGVLSTALSSLMANQLALSVASNNIANAGDPDFTRRRLLTVPAGSDSVDLSSKAKELDRLANAIDESRTERFNKVREALESGTYQVSARGIAQKLIDANKK